MHYLDRIAGSALRDNNRSACRDDENESDQVGVALANKTGYAPNGLVTFLTSLKERNKAKTAKSEPPRRRRGKTPKQRLAELTGRVGVARTSALGSRVTADRRSPVARLRYDRPLCWRPIHSAIARWISSNFSVGLNCNSSVPASTYGR